MILNRTPKTLKEFDQAKDWIQLRIIYLQKRKEEREKETNNKRYSMKTLISPIEEAPKILHNYKAIYTDDFDFVVTAIDLEEATKIARACQPYRILKSIDIDYNWE